MPDVLSQLQMQVVYGEVRMLLLIRFAASQAADERKTITTRTEI